jgi:hypothetical protein
VFPMLDEPDEETLDDRLERIQRRAENFRELLKDGDEVTIACLDGDLHVEESYRSQLERKSPKLYGRMLSVEAQMETGLVPYFVAMIAAGLFFFGLQLSWWNSVLNDDVQDLMNRWWFFIALPLLLVFITHRGVRLWERAIYRKNRQDLLDLIAEAKLDRDTLVVMLRDDDEVGGVVRELKLDRGPFTT